MKYMKSTDCGSWPRMAATFLLWCEPALWQVMQAWTSPSMM